MKEVVRSFLWGLIVVTLLLSVSFGLRAEPLTTQEAAKKLSASVYWFGLTGQSRGFCTATKIGPREYLTARHCAEDLERNFRLDGESGYVFIRSTTITTSTKKGQRYEDWAILNATTENDAPALDLGCGDEVKVGDAVAYMGYPQGLKKAFAVGYVATKEQGTSKNNADFFVDILVAPGSSGSAIISMETGHVIGVLTEGVVNYRTLEFYATGVEDIQNLDECADWNKLLKEWEETGDLHDIFPTEDTLDPKAPWVDWT